MNTPLRVKLLRDGARPPRYATDGAAGLDLCAALEETLSVPARGTAMIPTGIAIELPPGHEGQVRPRSGLARRHGITVLNAPGTIDEDYRGEISVLLVNHSEDAFEIATGDRIAQLVVAPVARVVVHVSSDSESLSDTARGEGGFGSTGRR